MTNSSKGRLPSSHRKYNFWWAFILTESVWEVHFRSWEIVVPRNFNESTIDTVLLRTVRVG